MKAPPFLLALAATISGCFAQIQASFEPIEAHGHPNHICSLEYPPDSEKFPQELLDDVISKMGYGGRSVCLDEQLPLGIVFANYTVDSTGAIIQDGGWAEAERAAYRGFICKMMPILVQLYGLPFERYDLTLIRDRRYVNSNIFVPTERSIRMSGFYWTPQLLTHELLHAFRGSWHLTRSNNASQYSPALSGFEEGFAQGVSYEAMNAYLDLYGADEYVTRNFLWTPDTEWDYDYKNDLSMVTEDFWSESGGTSKFFERYEQAAAAIQQLRVRIPDFYRRFNEVYYNNIRTIPNYQPSRQGIIDIIDWLTYDADIRTWIDQQNILQCRTVFGKKVYTTTNKGAYEFAWHRIHFVETFPNKSEWYYSVPGQGYLYHRLNYRIGYLNVYRAWNDTSYKINEVLNIKDLPGWGPEQACGINCSKGFGADDLMFYFGTVPPRTGFNNPLLLRHPEQGVYGLRFQFSNPHYSMTPDYGIFYDQYQSQAIQTKHELLGIPSVVWNENRIFGGVVGLPNGVGFVRMTHSLHPTTLVAVVNNGVFVSPGLSDWFQPVRGTPAKKPGIMTFEIQDTKGRTHTEKRYVLEGNNGAKHKFLFRVPPAPLMIKATGPE